MGIVEKMSLASSNTYMFTPIEDVLGQGDKLFCNFDEYEIALLDALERISIYDQMMMNASSFDQRRVFANFYDYFLSIKDEFEKKFSSLQWDFGFYMGRMNELVNEVGFESPVMSDGNIYFFDSYAQSRQDYFKLKRLLKKQDIKNNDIVTLYRNVVLSIDRLINSIRSNFCA